MSGNETGAASAAPTRSGKPPKQERAAALRTGGWVRLACSGAQTWCHPRHGTAHFFTLAAAELDERHKDNPTWWDRRAERG